MKVIVSRTFEKNIRDILDKKFALTVKNVISKIEQCHSLSEITNLKKMKGSSNYYRIQIGDFV